ncbi:hypothetical protein Nepgr_000157 [Nepenthes gracilis]|uniref:Beta-glucosidase n=1 Tax=Nepenthes gracilis TaxID=150966 RepID=A0AAD3P357_NEPGR|nr:hypothetical protein Nepgr_000157 [Nepenthes gracilis]
MEGTFQNTVTFALFHAEKHIAFPCIPSVGLQFLEPMPAACVGYQNVKFFLKGFIISDWERIEMLCDPHGSDYCFCISSTVKTGIVMVMVTLRYEKFLEDLTYLVESGEIPMSRIDDAVEQILRVKFAARLFEHLFTDRNAKKILVAGTHADDLGYQCRGWTATKHGSSGRITIGTTILDAVKAVVGDKTVVMYEQFPSVNTLAREDFSYAIVAVDKGQYAEFSGDNSELTIPFNGADIICSVVNKIPTLVILISGRPLDLQPWLLEKIVALIAAWLPGSE